MGSRGRAQLEPPLLALLEARGLLYEVGSALLREEVDLASLRQLSQRDLESIGLSAAEAAAALSLAADAGDAASEAPKNGAADSKPVLAENGAAENGAAMAAEAVAATRTKREATHGEKMASSYTCAVRPASTTSSDAGGAGVARSWRAPRARSTLPSESRQCPFPGVEARAESFSRVSCVSWLEVA